MRLPAPAGRFKEGGWGRLLAVVAGFGSMVPTMVETPAPDSLPAPAFGPESEEMLRCARCELRYVPSKSTSALRLTYCSFLCELGDLGFSIAGLEHMEPNPPAIEAPDVELDPQPGEPAVVE